MLALSAEGAPLRARARVRDTLGHSFPFFLAAFLAAAFFSAAASAFLSAAFRLAAAARAFSFAALASAFAAASALARCCSAGVLGADSQGTAIS